MISNAEILLASARQERRDGDLPACEMAVAAALSEADAEKVPEVAYHAFACLGRVYLSRAEPKQALSCFQEAMAVAVGHGLSHWIGPSLHDLYVTGKEARIPKARREWGAKAFQLYSERNRKAPQITGLLADFAEETMYAHPQCRDSASHAFHAWRVVPVSMDHPRFHMAAAANAMYAAALMSSPNKYRSAGVALDFIFAGLPHHEHAARNLVHASVAATIMRDYPRAAELAERALTVAKRRSETNVCEWGEEVLSAARAERTAVLL